MSKDKIGNQTIGCSVRSCRYNDQGNYCELSRIEVKPCTKHEHSRTGTPEDESLCGSYQMK
ncbi:MAG: DUF1540 domain-containing protein [Clostridia bacterium]|nr:DUF1540 domain-containing protein [Clostridia bacterium]